jgi:TRAP-type C4-dicarboxylate transport system substrate-binding protein
MRTRAFVAAGLLAILAGSAACGGPGTKAGSGGAEHTIVLTMANGVRGGEPLGRYADEVSRLSNGSIRIKIVSGWRSGDPRSERRLIADVKAGKADLGWVGARAWDGVGVSAFQALVAPFLIDSYALEERVLAGPIAGEMLAGVRSAGVVGLGLLPGPMRELLGVRKPFVRPADFVGSAVGIQQSGVAALTFRTLGATARAVPAQSTLDGLDAYEQQLGSIAGNRYYRQAKYVTTNVDLWPRPLVVFAGRHRFESLTREQQGVLRQAARSVIPAYVDAARDEDREAGRILCGAGMRLVRARPAELSDLRSAVEPVYQQLERNGRTRSFIARIRALKSEADGDDVAACRASGPRAGGASALDGVYSMETRYSDNSADPVPVAENYGSWIFVLDRGRFAFTQEFHDACTWGYGKFTLAGHEMAWTFTDGGGIAPNGASNKPGEFFKFGWSRYRDTLTLTRVKGAISPMNFRLNPWHLESSTASSRYLSKKCPPPKEALP